MAASSLFFVQNEMILGGPNGKKRSRDVNLLILWGSFSDDMTTTGIGLAEPSA
jgi:hypothetical protein